MSRLNQRPVECRRAGDGGKHPLGIYRGIGHSIKISIERRQRRYPNKGVDPGYYLQARVLPDETVFCTLEGLGFSNHVGHFAMESLQRVVFRCNHVAPSRIYEQPLSQKCYARLVPTVTIMDARERERRGRAREGRIRELREMENQFREINLGNQDPQCHTNKRIICTLLKRQHFSNTSKFKKEVFKNK